MASEFLESLRAYRDAIALALLVRLGPSCCIQVDVAPDDDPWTPLSKERYPYGERATRWLVRVLVQTALPLTTHAVSREPPPPTLWQQRFDRESRMPTPRDLADEVAKLHALTSSPREFAPGQKAG